MKLDQLPHGEQFTLRLAPSSGSLPAQPAKHSEIRLDFPGRQDLTLLGCDGWTTAVDGVDDNSKRRLRTLQQIDPTRLCWLVHHEPTPDGPILTVQTHRFHSRIHWDVDLDFGLDERVIERVNKKAGRQFDAEGAAKWLADRVFLPPAAPGGLTRAVATGDPDDGGPFRLLGKGVALDITTRDEQLVVDKVVGLRTGGRGHRPPEFLIEACMGFSDATLTGKVRQSVKSQLDRIVAEASGSYLALWQRYQAVEREQILRRARELGWLAYKSARFMPSGWWRFEATSNQELNEFVDRLPTEEQELEAGSKPPAILLDESAEDEQGKSGERPMVGRVARVDWKRLHIYLRPLDEDSDAMVPTKGALFMALHGDRTRLRRREDAVQRLVAADARMPQLALIVEGREAPMRRADRERPMSEASRGHFAFDPTPAQRDALDRALNTPDIALIQGPPGTGKTTVIAALQARLTEIEADRPEIAGRTLLTSYQHDAVDNAVGRSEVFGIPPARFGGRAGARPFDEQADRWAARARERITARMAELDEGRPRATYKHFRDRVAVHAAGRLPPDLLAQLLDDLIDLPAGVLSTTLWERLRMLRSRKAKPQGDDLQRNLQLKAARGIRPVQAAFTDDGPARALRAVNALEGILDNNEKALLQRAAAVEPGQPFDKVEKLAKLRDALLDRLSTPVIPGDTRQRDPEVHEALNMAVAELHTRMEQSPSGRADALQEYAETLKSDPNEVVRTLRQYSAVFAASCQQTVGHPVIKAMDLDTNLEFENVVVDEAARANPLDLFIPLSLAKRRVVLVGDHRQLPHMLEPEVERELDQSVEQSTQEALRQSLFERLFRDLGEREQSDGVCRVVTLDQQFRMHPTLGRFVSDVFYKPHDEAFASPRPANEFEHRLPEYSRAGQPICAAWKHLPLSKGKERRVGTSWERKVEARWIAEEVKRLLDGPAHDLTVGVITFYTGQRDAILEAMKSPGLTEVDPDIDDLVIAPQWRELERSDGRRVERLRVGTVDAFQGMEFDVVFLSVTRSNAFEPENERQLRGKYGHLLLPNRMCVALSRQQRLLIVVGDQEMFDDELATREVPGLAKFLELCGGDDGLVT
jgi:hypothetical protein